MSSHQTVLNDTSRGAASTRRRKAWRGPTISILLLTAGVTSLTGFYDLHRMPSQTMEPTISVREVGVYAPLDNDEVRLGDVVRVAPDWTGGQVVTFRVVGMSGDTLSRDESGQLSRNGEELEEPYLSEHATMSSTPFNVDVPDGRVFLAGDSRAISNDSTAHVQDGAGGSVSLSDVSERLVGVAWPAWNWSIPASQRSLPLPFIIASLAIGVGALLLVHQLGRAALAMGASISSLRSRR